MPSTTATPAAAPSGSAGRARAGRSSRSASAGSASMPTTSEVMVMPSWVPESWKESLRRAATTLRARRSPSAAARSAAGRSTVTRPNSAATKKPLARIRTRAAASSSREVLMRPPLRIPGREGRRRYYRTVRPSGWECHSLAGRGPAGGAEDAVSRVCGASVAGDARLQGSHCGGGREERWPARFTAVRLPAAAAGLAERLGQRPQPPGVAQRLLAGDAGLDAHHRRGWCRRRGRAGPRRRRARG